MPLTHSASYLALRRCLLGLRTSRWPGCTSSAPEAPVFPSPHLFAQLSPVHRLHKLAAEALGMSPLKQTALDLGAELGTRHTELSARHTELSAKRPDPELGANRSRSSP